MTTTQNKRIRKAAKKIHKATLTLAEELTDEVELDVVTTKYVGHKLGEVVGYLNHLFGVGQQDETEEEK